MKPPVNACRSLRERLLQSACYELGAIALFGPPLSAICSLSRGESAALLAATSFVMLLWTASFNAAFDRLELRCGHGPASARPQRLRLLHAIALECSALAVTAPILAAAGGLGWSEAVAIDLALSLVYAGYGYLFHLAFDRLRPVANFRQLSAPPDRLVRGTPLPGLAEIHAATVAEVGRCEAARRGPPMSSPILYCAIALCVVAALDAPAAAEERNPVLRGPAVLSDQVPLPEPELVVAGPAGDRVVKARSGDPFFLAFAAGSHYPPPLERVDPGLGDAIARLGGDARPSEEIYAFVMLNRRLTGARLAALTATGLRVLGFQPHYALRAAIPVAAIPAVAANDSVQWIGLPRRWQKVHPHLANRIAADAGGQHEVYLSVFESDLCASSTSTAGPRAELGGPGTDVTEGPASSASRRWQSHGWQQQALEAEGASVREYLPERNAFRARLSTATLERVLALDFVAFAEAVVRARAYHDESMPMVLADYGRASYPGDVSQQVRAGIIDSGFDHAHTALDNIFWAQWAEVDPGTTGAGSDVCGHGTHVAGTMIANPSAASAAHRGVVPRLATWPSGRFRIVKWLADDCGADSPLLATVVTHFRGNVVDASGVVSLKPNVINNSYGTDGAWIGSEVDAQVIDSEVFNEDQVYVFAAGNGGPGAGTIGLPAVAKNALTVGNVIDWNNGTNNPPASLSTNSARGPCADGRWKPNLVAPGNSITSVQANSGTGFTAKTGTSMAAPHVAGLVAQLADQNAAMRSDPARVMSLLQATALTFDDEVLDNENELHLDEYGCGRINAAKMLNATSADWSWINFDVAPDFTITTPTFEYADFLVPAGTQRMVVTMTYVEPASLSGAPSALLHDWDLYIDQPPVSAAGNIGDYTAQQSAVDNTEIRIIEDPIAGVWRWKAYPANVLTPLFDQAKMSITVVLISGDTTPSATFTLSADDTFVRPGETVNVTAEVAIPSYVGSAVFLDSNASPTQPLYTGATTTLIDGPVTNLLGNQHYGRDVMLGDILGSSARDATWSVYWPGDGVMNFAVTASGDNIASQVRSVNVTVDGTPPSTVTALHSFSHATGVWSNVPKVEFLWNFATDTLSGVAGYGLLLSTGAPAPPELVIDTTSQTYSQTLASHPQGYYLSVRTADKCGNWSSTSASAGPYLIDTLLPNIATGLSSPTHQPNVWSNLKTVSVGWTPAIDGTSGLAGYSLLWSSGAPTLPDAVPDIGAVTSAGQTFGSSATGKYLNLRSVDQAGNWSASAASLGPFLIDLAAPGTPGTVQSPSHAIGVPSTNANIAMSWSAAADAHSGIAGYDTLWSHAQDSVPDGAVDTATISQLSALAPSPEDWWFHIRAKDLAGNLGDLVHVGPYRIGLCTQPAASASYGTGKAGSLGIPQLVALAPPVLGGTTTIEIQAGLPGALPILLIGGAAAATPYDLGTILVAPLLVFPLPVPLSATGSLALPGPLPFDAALCGGNLYLQAIIPDPAAGGLQHLAMTPGLQLTLGS